MCCKRVYTKKFLCTADFLVDIFWSIGNPFLAMSLCLTKVCQRSAIKPQRKSILILQHSYGITRIGRKINLFINLSPTSLPHH